MQVLVHIVLLYQIDIVRHWTDITDTVYVFKFTAWRGSAFMISCFERSEASGLSLTAFVCLLLHVNFRAVVRSWVEAFWNSVMMERKYCCGTESRQANVNRRHSFLCSTNQSSCVDPCDLSSRIIDHPLPGLIFVACLRKLDKMAAAPLLCSWGSSGKTRGKYTTCTLRNLSELLEGHMQHVVFRERCFHIPLFL
jgi:hypothetical protein